MLEEASPTISSPIAWRKLLESPSTADLLRSALEAGIIVDTWLTSHWRNRMTPEAKRFLMDQTTPFKQACPTLAITPGLQKIAFQQVLLSTAIYNGFRSKQKEVSLAVAEKATAQVQSFANTHGFEQIIHLFVIISSYESYKTLAKYGSLEQKEFTKGTKHRPWSDVSSEDELALGLSLADLEVRSIRTKCEIFLSRQGQNSLQHLEVLVTVSGWLDWQVHQQNIMQLEYADALFSDTESYINYDASYHLVATTVAEETSRFLNFAGIEPGMRVLEVGCGTGRMTLDLGLVTRVLPGGNVIASDPSLWMLRKFQDRLKENRTPCHHLTLSLAKGENLPFPNASFDAALGFAFLPYTTDPLQVIREMSRTVRPGGQVSTAVFLKWDFQAFSNFSSWLKPLLEIIRSHDPSFNFNGMEAGQTATIFEQVGLVEVETIPFSVPWVVDNPRVLRFAWELTAFSKIHDLLPSAEQRLIIRKIEDIGESICTQTNDEQRTLVINYEAVRGLVPE